GREGGRAQAGPLARGALWVRRALNPGVFRVAPEGGPPRSQWNPWVRHSPPPPGPGGRGGGGHVPPPLSLFSYTFAAPRIVRRLRELVNIAGPRGQCAPDWFTACDS